MNEADEARQAAMIGRRTGHSLALGAIALVLAGCQGPQGIQRFLPRDETPVLPPAFAVEVPRGASGQRLNARGYPMLGHMPRAATAQASPATVTATERRYANVENRGTAATGTTAARLQGVAARQAAAARDTQYQQTVEELRALAEAQRAGSQTN